MHNYVTAPHAQSDNTTCTDAADRHDENTAWLLAPTQRHMPTLRY